MSGPPGPAALAWFDLTRGLPTAWRALRAALGPERARRAMIGTLRWRFRWDPFAELAPPVDAGERFTRHQLGLVLWLDRALKDDLGLDPGARAAAVAKVVAQTGARFVAATFQLPDPDGWRALDRAARTAFARRVIARFGNATAEVVDVGDDRIAFDVTACHFVSLCARLGRRDLAPHFCAADAVYFGAPDSPLRLERASTLADGAPRCPFRLRFTGAGAAPTEVP